GGAGGCWGGARGGPRRGAGGGPPAAAPRGKPPPPPAGCAPPGGWWAAPPPDATRRTLTPEHDPEEFWATCGGMGLTGTVVEATIDLHPIETSLLAVDSDRVPDLDTLLALMVEGGHRHRYSVAWVDFLARGRSLGRSVVNQGDFA